MAHMHSQPTNHQKMEPLSKSFSDRINVPNKTRDRAKKIIFCSFLGFFIHHMAVAQCTVAAVSSNGWTATINYYPTAATPSTTNCQWFYHYAVASHYSVSFSGSMASRSVSFNVYYTCNSNGGNCQQHQYVGTFTANASGNVTTNYNCAFNAVTAYNYGNKPGCTNITLGNSGCTTARLELWGNGITNANANCPLANFILPLKLASFTGACNKQQAVLQWRTATETNNHLFTVERSEDATNWQVAGNINGAAGTSHYAFTDAHSATGKTYYRLKHTDVNGEVTYSTIITVANCMHEIGELTTYPSPTKGMVHLLYNDEAQVTSIEVYNVSGERVYHIKNYQPTIDLSGQQNGLYYIRFTLKSKVIIKKIVLQR
jgi:hypothetical protein